jgi:hypothetical protein
MEEREIRGGRERANKSKRELESGMERLRDRVERGGVEKEGEVGEIQEERREVKSGMERDREGGRMRKRERGA